MAQPTPIVPLDGAVVRDQVKTILQDPAFAYVFESPPVKDSAPVEGWMEPFLAIIGSLAPLSLLVMALLVGVGAIALWMHRRSLRGAKEIAPAPIPTPLMTQQAEQHRSQGLVALENRENRAAIRHFFRAALAHTAQVRQIRLAPSDTNHDVFVALGESAPACLEALVVAQEHCVFGGKVPSSEAAKGALDDLDTLMASASLPPQKRKV